MNARRARLQSRHWFGKTLAGAVLGYTLALRFPGGSPCSRPAVFPAKARCSSTCG